ncbi:hypothetical protein SESBI_13492 [Sesbania bispinosa]|nr:hypothetical protein SESBI_13492 [Sesbania bispinosa]
MRGGDKRVTTKTKLLQGAGAPLRGGRARNGGLQAAARGESEASAGGYGLRWFSAGAVACNLYDAGGC